ncbi:hypothetical protein QOZ80_5BG0415130 [Eleusine coracana subsp. coracana]|nr:hypothetical protein QOZ80_5BG0415130 [Eleusine coracana subsp. coracana]
MAMVATDAAGLGPGATVTDDLVTSPPAKYSGSKATGADAFQSSKRRIPRGPDPIHNRRAEKTVAPRRRD